MVKLIRKSIAFARRTFVADCPLCHKHFYGFHDYKEQVMIKSKNYRYICHRCAEKEVMKKEVL